MKLKILLVFAALSAASLAQTTNLEIIYNLVDKSLTKIKPEYLENYVLKFNSDVNLDVIKGRVRYKLGKSDKTENVVSEIDYSVDSVKVKYPEIFRDGVFGDYYLIRNISYAGYYTISQSESTAQSETFSFLNSDTLLFSNHNKIENQALDITKGDLPAEPFFDSLLETVIAVGSAVLSIILFFTVRSE